MTEPVENQVPPSPSTPSGLTADQPNLVEGVPSFSWRQQFQFILKEWRETLRDRRTIVTLLLMPLLLYPLLGIGFRFLGIQQSNDLAPEINVVGENEQDLQLFVAILDVGRKRLISQQVDETELPIPNFFLLEDEATTLEQQVRQSFDLGVRLKPLPEGQSPGPFGPVQIELLQNRASPSSRDLADNLERLLQAAEKASLEQWAVRQDPEFEFPIELTRSLIDPPEQPSAILGLLPLILLLMTVTGGVYPAIDLTAGERERNTLETLIGLPVPRFRLLLAKYVAVVTVTLLTGLMNLAAMSITLYALQIDKVLLGEAGFGLSLAAKLLIVLTCFALFYSAVLLLLTSSARSFKEAQAYLIPLLLLSITPGLIILLPGWSLQQTTAVIPIVNLLLLGREFMEGTAQGGVAIVALLSTVLYGAASLALAARVFGNDAVGTGSNRWSELLKPSNEDRSGPSTELSLIGLALLFPAYFVTSGILGRADWELPMEGRLLATGLMTIVLFAGLPWLLMKWQGIDVRSGFQMFSFPWLGLVGAVLLGISVWPWVFEMVILAKQLGIGSVIEGMQANPEMADKVAALLEGWRAIPLWMIVIAMGVIPGVCEESFFRGFLFSGLRRSLKPWPTILITAALFGLFHVILAGGMAPIRILPSTLMGILLGWVTVRSGSLIPAIVLHVIHNSTLLCLVSYREILLNPLLGEIEDQHLPISWLAVSAAIAIAGGLLVWSSRRTG